MKEPLHPALLTAMEAAILDGFTTTFYLKNGFLYSHSLPERIYFMTHVMVVKITPFPEILINLYRIVTKDNLIKGTFTTSLSDLDFF